MAGVSAASTPNNVIVNNAVCLQDLSRWKTRRRSLNSDLHRKKEEREQLEPVTGETDNVREEPKQRYTHIPRF